jgi:hypothetical protein
MYTAQQAVSNKKVARSSSLKAKENGTHIA